jgi:hypothetical protein
VHLEGVTGAECGDIVAEALGVDEIDGIHLRKSWRECNRRTGRLRGEGPLNRPDWKGHRRRPAAESAKRRSALLWMAPTAVSDWSLGKISRRDRTPAGEPLPRPKDRP